MKQEVYSNAKEEIQFYIYKKRLDTFIETVTETHKKIKIAPEDTQIISFTEVAESVKKLAPVEYKISEVKKSTQVTEIIEKFEKLIYTAENEAVYCYEAAQLEEFKEACQKSTVTEVKSFKFEELKTYKFVESELKHVAEIKYDAKKITKEETTKLVETVKKYIYTSTSEIVYLKYNTILETLVEEVNKAHPDYKIEKPKDIVSYEKVQETMKEVKEVKYTISELKKVEDVTNIIDEFKKKIYTAPKQILFYIYSAQLEIFVKKVQETKKEEFAKIEAPKIETFEEISKVQKTLEEVDVKEETIKKMKSEEILKKVEEIKSMVYASDNEIKFLSYQEKLSTFVEVCKKVQPKVEIKPETLEIKESFEEVKKVVEKLDTVKAADVKTVKTVEQLNVAVEEFKKKIYASEDVIEFYAYQHALNEFVDKLQEQKTTEKTFEKFEVAPLASFTDIQESQKKLIKIDVKEETVKKMTKTQVEEKITEIKKLAFSAPSEIAYIQYEAVLTDLAEAVEKVHSDFKMKIDTETTSYEEVQKTLKDVKEVKYDITKISTISEVKTTVSEFKKSIYTASTEAVYFSSSQKLDTFIEEVKKAKKDKEF